LQHQGHNDQDQIIIGTTNNDIRMNALNNQWGLNDVIMNGRKHEADNRSQKADRRGKGNWKS